LIKKKSYCIGVLLVTLFISSCFSKENKLPPLKESYSQKDKNPFGVLVFYNQLQQLYTHNTIRSLKNNFNITWRDISDTGSLYVTISQNLFLSKLDLEAVLAYVESGNTLFISSNNIDQQLLDTLGCNVAKDFYQQTFEEMKYTGVSLVANEFKDAATYQYFYVPFYNHFSKLDSTNSKILGSNNAGTNFIVVFYGKGRFYLHTDPRALSNYFLLQNNNYKYFQHLFSFTPAIPEHVYWDDYNNKKNFSDKKDDRNGLAVLLRYPAMAWAFWLLLLLFGLYILFGGKRRQRIIDPIAPNTNTTLAFTETISRLYLQKKDNRNIADKLITYLLEQIRNQYYLNTSQINDEFISTLSRKSNNTKEGTEKLFKLINTIHQAMEVSDQQLLLLNLQIENFYKKQL
jgi:hypothetical protein